MSRSRQSSAIISIITNTWNSPVACMFALMVRVSGEERKKRPVSKFETRRGISLPIWAWFVISSVCKTVRKPCVFKMSCYRRRCLINRWITDIVWANRPYNSVVCVCSLIHRCVRLYEKSRVFGLLGYKAWELTVPHGRSEVRSVTRAYFLTLARWVRFEH